VLKLAVIGCGRIAQKKHTEAIIKNSDIIENVAVCDLKEERAKQFASKVENSGLNKPEIYTDYSKLLKRTDIDAVAIATESGNHYEITMEALQNNKHVLVEKPMALSTKHMNEMIEFAKRKNLKLGVCFQNRFNPPIQELRKKITTDSFGRILHGQASIRWNRNEEYYKQAKWRGTWEYDGGTLMNQCTHNIDLLLWNMGSEIDEIYGVIKNFTHPYIEAEDFGGAIVKFKNGSVGIIEGSANIYPKNLEALPLPNSYFFPSTSIIILFPSLLTKLILTPLYNPILFISSTKFLPPLISIILYFPVSICIQQGHPV